MMRMGGGSRERVRGGGGRLRSKRLAIWCFVIRVVYILAVVIRMRRVGSD